MSLPTKIIKIGVDAREELVKGANFMADAVKSTFGPYGQNFLLEKGNRITNDGVSVAREMESTDEIQNRGLNALREAAIKTDEEAGDGTTTATILAQAILKEAVKQLPTKTSIVGKMTPYELRTKIEAECAEIVDKLLAMAIPVETKEKLIEAAKVSVGDAELAELIGSTQFNLGKDGVLIVEEDNDIKCSIEEVNGIRLDDGFGTALIVTNQEEQSLELSNQRVLLTNHTITSLIPLKPILESLVKTGVRELVIIARAFSAQAIKDCMENTARGFRVSPVNAPYTDQSEIMRDLAALTGARYVFDEEMDLESVQLSDFGFIERIIAKRFTAVVTGVKNVKTQETVSKRIEELNKKLAGSESAFEKKNIQTRIAQFTNGFAIVKIGGQSEKERKFKYDKAVDAVNATRAAFQEGVVPGAGIAFKTIADTLPDTYLLKKAIVAPYEQIRATAPIGFEVPAWVMDSVKVLRIALEKASSVAASLATAGGATATKKEKPRLVQEVTRDNNEE